MKGILKNFKNSRKHKRETITSFPSLLSLKRLITSLQILIILNSIKNRRISPLMKICPNH
jgi:hypothetical protein